MHRPLPGRRPGRWRNGVCGSRRRSPGWLAAAGRFSVRGRGRPAGLCRISLGRLHAATVGCTTPMRPRCAGHIRPPACLGRSVKPGSPALSALQPPCSAERCPRPKLRCCSQRMRDPGPWLALVHGDPCPDNVLLTPQGAALLDFEFAAPGHALLDAAYWRMGFPTCWCAGRVPDAVAERHGAGLSRHRGGGHSAGPGRRRSSSANIAIAVARPSVRQPRMASGRGPEGRQHLGDRDTTRNRILWHLQASDRSNATSRCAARLCAELFQAWLTDLERRWPDVQPLPAFPAFATSGVG